MSSVPNMETRLGNKFWLAVSAGERDLRQAHQAVDDRDLTGDNNQLVAFRDISLERQQRTAGGGSESLLVLFSLLCAAHELLR